MAMMLKVAPNSTLIGSTTKGSDGDQTGILLPGNILTSFSGQGVYFPDGAETQRVGIAPDIEVLPTIEGIRNGNDEVLEKAVNLLIQEIKKNNTP